ncbi:diaminopimelate epimerase [Helicobacter cetorum]|uniref:diaminopimelate epimerase n=1 Tax=Helicobacter cetorum TaxID=138563 RepID=UPI000CF10688|nr:diaminopimelate epimerase [Helicobacter cetorum]
MVFYKYSGSGNDFLITHAFKEQDFSLLAKQICHRHEGFGTDGLVVLLPHAHYPYTWDFYNSDGSRANMCGNASRCVGLHAYKHQLAPKNHTFLAGKREISISIEEPNIVESNLGHFQILENISQLQIAKQATLKSFLKEIATWHLIDTGVPHLVGFVKEKTHLDSLDLNDLKALRHLFNANVNIAYIKDEKTIFLHTYERGVENITLACGTGMGAVFVIAHLNYHLNSSATLIPTSQDRLNLSLKDKQIFYKGIVRYIGMSVTEPNLLLP